MAVLVRTSQSILCCHRSDPSLVEPAMPTADAQWVLADGQPPGCTRFQVRALNPDEFQAMRDGKSGEDRAKFICATAFLTVDGTAPGDLTFGWVQEVANLIVAVTTDPLDGRARASEGAKEVASNANASPQTSSSTSPVSADSPSHADVATAPAA